MADATKYRQYDGQPLSNVLRREIRKARLRVTLDEELGRTTPDAVKKLAAFELPPIVRERPQDEGTADRRRDGWQTLSNALRTKILKARLRVTLDEQLGRTTPESAKKLAALDLPPFVRVPRQDGRAAERRTPDPQNDAPASSTFDRALLSNELRMKIRKAQLRVTLDEQLGRTTPESAKKLAALPLPPLFRVPRQDENAADRRTSDSENDGPTRSPSDRASLSNALRMKILKAQLRVTLDEQLGRTTPEREKKLAALDLPPIVRVPRRRENAENRRTCDSLNEEPDPGTTRREVLVARMKVSLDELRGRDTAPELRRLSRMRLAPIRRGKHLVDDAVGREP
ncbi:hypothetical protein [Arthrobacter sp.]|uniref:hypothetical protein n=1 Tax=Arthrobacter sp. TaxID=1667 RepID=UPI003A8DF27F